MRRFALLVSLLLLAFSGRAWADPVGDLQARVVKLENDWAQLDGRRIRLEYETSTLGGDIERMKAEPAGVRRDYQLRDLLAQAKSKADELTRVAAELRWRSTALGDARKQLVALCDKSLATPGLPEARRLELARLRTAQVALIAAPLSQGAQVGKMIGKVTAPVSVDPLDGPRELKEKADLLRDSEDKLKREVQRLATRIDDVERRRHLRERIGAVDDDLFGEAVSNRRVARIGGAAAQDHSKTSTSSDSANPTMNPAPMAGGTSTGGTSGASTGGTGGTPPTGGFTNGPTGGTSGSSGTSGGTGGGGASTGGGGSTSTTPAVGGERAGDTTVLRNFVDSSTVDELRRADGGDDLERQVRALKRAQNELSGMAAELERRAKTLSTRADELKRQK